MGADQKHTIKGIETLKKCILKLIPLASLDIIEKIQSELKQYLSFSFGTQLDKKGVDEQIDARITVENCVSVVLESLKKLKTAIRVQSISHSDRYRVHEEDKHLELDKIVRHSNNHSYGMKNLPLMSMKWKQVNEGLGSRESIPDATVDLDGVALLASTIPRLELSIDRITGSRHAKRFHNKASMDRKSHLHRLSFQSQKNKRLRDQKSQPLNPNQSPNPQQLFLKSVQMHRIPRNYRIQRLI